MDADWIASTAALEDWIAALPAGALAVDTEADSFHSYREKVCLVQLSGGGRHALVDPLAGVDLAPLGAPLGDAARPKILHGADYDVRLLRRDFDLGISPLRDTSIAARLTGEPAVGLAALLEKHLGIRLDKSHQRADWSRRPLGPELRAYAVSDTRHLEELSDVLDAQARALGRESWIREECARLEAVRFRERRDDDAEPFRRVKGASALDPAGLAVLREVWGWREEAARRKDRPPFRILREETLLAIVRARPGDAATLASIPGFPEPFRRPPALDEILTAVSRGVACPESERPARIVSRRKVLEPAVERALEGLRAARDAVARELALDASLIASRAILEEMAARVVRGDDPFATPDLRDWQAGLMRARLR